ncbi:hypothetical protein DW074_00590 [Ruminococcus sp. AF46-10NS]|nr:hypothetical protein DW074_00590 [Ruminococcus sp. AF46-10NS]
MRAIIERLDDTAGIFGGGGDGAIVEDGKLKRNDCPRKVDAVWKSTVVFTETTGSISGSL